MNYQQYRPAGFNWLTPVVKNLLIINILFFVAKVAIARAYPDMDIADIFGLRFPGAQDFRFYQIITYMFLHADFWHLFFNMFALWMFGKPIEERFGTKRFLIYYFVTGIGAAATHYTVMYFHDFPALFGYVNEFIADPNVYTLQDVLASESIGYFRQFNHYTTGWSNLPISELEPRVAEALTWLQSDKTMLLNSFNVIGASGAVFGLLLAFGMLYPNTLIYLYFAIPIKAKWFVVIFGALELFQGIRGSGSNVAHLAHIGGMLFGFILIKLWHRKSKGPNYIY